MPGAAITIGPAVVGSMIAGYLFGCSTMQTYTYYKRFPGDRRVFQILVAAVMMLTFAHIICIMYWTWTLTVTGCENPDGVTIFSSSRDANIVLTPLISTLVQMFFIYRLFKFSGSKMLAAFCGIFSMLTLTGTLVDAAKALDIPTNRTGKNALNWLTILTLVAATVCDLVITIGLVYFLQRERRRTIFDQIHNIAVRITLWVIETGLATSMSTILVIVLFCATRNTFLWTAVYNVLADVYTNSLLAALNSRETTCRRDTRVIEVSTGCDKSLNPISEKSEGVN
ncbi:uncharacterized protein EDB93DRAFT_1182218 [Suillus bovinus]|uniref:uncharacterized protein n=1 Tax=Suillus bovinus TaxID=48563 RepID=UPI001B87EF24|nr:uncharacterized protein EDB93DRAFT_1182974 [Suillus bovinus]XP_041301813.1 uncharacterized protein EDB93DRAFT_1182218 [Suillus bovinus]KAG2129168.1 hypothetical protein EDB93DRAFT_1182974 [Suillus bovinus]KAG2129672.1 hypothetical protein EDB93DRAFT_1182218 [Suillus bovinus]